MARRGGWVARSGGVGLLALAMLGVGAAFLWFRVTLPGEPSQVPTDAWDWSADGVVVVPIGSGPGPFLAGDRVVAIDGVSVEALAAAAVDPRQTAPSPTGGPPGGVSRFTVARAGAVEELDVELAVQPVGGTLASAIPLLAYTIVQACVALLAWLRRPTEGWRRGFLLGSFANLVNALIWEVGLRPTDLARPEPVLLLFGIAASLHLVFWSSIAHVLVRWPTRATGRLGSRAFVTAAYAAPQAAFAAGLVVTALAIPSTAAWLGAAERVVALVVLGQIVVVLVALGAAYRRMPTAADRSLRLIVAGCFVLAAAVAVLTAVPVLVTGEPLAPRSTVAALGLPLALVLLVGTLQSRLFEVDVLLASRRRLVLAREEERRRLRRDLHDGIGPMLAAMTLKADLARDLLRDDPAAADDALAALKADAQAAVVEIRRLTRELRPPSIDELGLAEALRQRMADLAAADGDRGAVISFTAARLPPLDAAVEVAAYRIALEAATNVVRHAGATRCDVHLEVPGPLVLEVRDDGTGFDPAGPAGVGLTSMRERCAELGGRLDVERTGDGWTVVRATLPTAG